MLQICIVFHFLRAFVADRTQLAFGIITLRKQMANFKRKQPRFKLQFACRLFWVIISKIWPEWKSTLIIVKPDTVVKWHRTLFKMYWNRKSRKNRKTGRPKISKQARDLIRQMSRENPTWGVPRIQSEMVMLGYDLATRSADHHMIHIIRIRTYRSDITGQDRFVRVPIMLRLQGFRRIESTV